MATVTDLIDPMFAEGEDGSIHAIGHANDLLERVRIWSNPAAMDAFNAFWAYTWNIELYDEIGRPPITVREQTLSLADKARAVREYGASAIDVFSREAENE